MFVNTQKYAYLCDMDKAERKSKGNAFEDYIYSKLERSISARRVKETAYSFPDIVCCSTRGTDTYEFAVECKYRSSMEDEVQIVKSKKQLEKYQKYHREERILFIALGIGGEPDHPEKVFIVPVMHLRDIRCTLEQLFLFEHWNLDKYIKFYHNSRSLR